MMKKILQVELVTHDEEHQEYVVYLVEDREPPKQNAALVSHLKRIQDRLFDCIDTVVKGQFAKQFPLSHGKRIRIQIDSPIHYSVEVADLICAVRQFIATDLTYLQAIQSSPYLESLRIVSGHEMGRFGGAKNRDGT